MNGTIIHQWIETRELSLDTFPLHLPSIKSYGLYFLNILKISRKKNLAVFSSNHLTFKLPSLLFALCYALPAYFCLHKHAGLPPIHSTNCTLNKPFKIQISSYHFLTVLFNVFPLFEEIRSSIIWFTLMPQVVRHLPTFSRITSLHNVFLSTFSIPIIRACLGYLALVMLPSSK